MDSDMRTRPLAIALALLLSSFVREQSSYGLPIRLEATSAEVQKVLGKPTETVVPENDEHTGHEGMSNMRVDPMRLDQWYDSAGIVGTFTGGKLTEIRIFPDTDYPNFVAYAGNIVKDALQLPGLGRKRIVLLRQPHPLSLRRLLEIPCD